MTSHSLTRGKPSYTHTQKQTKPQARARARVTGCVNQQRGRAWRHVRRDVHDCAGRVVVLTLCGLCVCVCVCVYSGKSVVLTVWGDNVVNSAELEGMENQAVLQCTACRVTDYNGTCTRHTHTHTHERSCTISI